MFWRLSLIVASAALLGVSFAAQPGFGGTKVPRDPAANIPIPTSAVPNACVTAPTGGICEAAAVAALNRASTSLGLGSYRLPRGFVSLPASRQLLVLANIDRARYGMRQLTGLNADVNSAAAHGMLTDSDPVYPSGLPAGAGWTSNWAGGAPNALFAYYLWMYDDGYGGGNIDCQAPTSSGCWGHRHNILAFPQAARVAMGAAVGTGRSGARSYAMEIVLTAP